MNLESIKTKIEEKKPIDEFIIFKYTDTDFIAHQYVHAYADYTNLEINTIDSINDFKLNSSFLINSIYLYKTDKFSFTTDKLLNIKNLYIVCKSIDKDTEKIYKDFIVDIPKLDEWQILDYINFNCPTVAKEIEYWAKTCTDMYMLENELDKISIFSIKKPKMLTATLDEKQLPGCVLTALKKDNAIYYLSNYNIFDLINALFTKDINKLILIYKSKLKIEPVLFYTLVHSTIEDIINITIDPNVTATKLNISNGKYWAVKNSYTGIWNKDILAKLLDFMSNLDILVKTGKLSFDDLLVNMIIEKILEEY